MFPKFVFVLTILLQGNCLLLKVIVSLIKILWASGSQSVLRRSQEIRDRFPEDPWLHVGSGYFEIYLFFKLK